jgi:ribosomal protein S18 acetylase RimI-like enzyme
MVEHLYVQPDFQRAGIGSALLEVAKSRRPGGLRLWVFQRNHGARAVYARHGFTEVRFTDGPDNEEQEPDVFLAYLRNGLDEQRERRSRPPLSDGRRSLGASPASVARCSLGRIRAAALRAA